MKIWSWTQNSCCPEGSKNKLRLNRRLPLKSWLMRQIKKGDWEYRIETNSMDEKLSNEKSFSLIQAMIMIQDGIPHLIDFFNAASIEISLNLPNQVNSILKGKWQFKLFQNQYQIPTFYTSRSAPVTGSHNCSCFYSDFQRVTATIKSSQGLKLILFVGTE